MSDSIYDVLKPYLDVPSLPTQPNLSDPFIVAYLNRITTLDIADLSTSEPASISQALHSNNRSIQALSKRAHKSIISAAEALAPLSSQLQSLVSQSQALKDALPNVESKAATFADKYRRSNETTNIVLQERRNALLLARNVDRIASVLELPTLLSSSISSSQQAGTGTSYTQNTTSSSIGSSINYGSALDLQAHVKRLTNLYPHSPLVLSVAAQSEVEMQHLTTNLITSLRSPNVKLAGGMRTIGWLRRVAPELENPQQHGKSTSRSTKFTPSAGSGDGALGALFLVCRLASLDTMLEALEPLRDLANDECQKRAAVARGDGDVKVSTTKSHASSLTGQQTERYLKRYIEIFREQSFAIVSMYKSIFPNALVSPGSQELQSTKPSVTTKQAASDDAERLLMPLPSSLATFPAHLVNRLYEILKTYLPNVTDPAARDSLLTQVLYCAGSMGRLGGDFSMMLALLEEDLQAADAAHMQMMDESQDDNASQPLEQEAEWVRVMKKHRIQASRLELLASGVGGTKSAAKDAVATSRDIATIMR